MGLTGRRGTRVDRKPSSVPNNRARRRLKPIARIVFPPIVSLIRAYVIILSGRKCRSIDPSTNEANNDRWSKTHGIRARNSRNETATRARIRVGITFVQPICNDRRSFSSPRTIVLIHIAGQFITRKDFSRTRERLPVAYRFQEPICFE